MVGKNTRICSAPPPPSFAKLGVWAQEAPKILLFQKNQPFLKKQNEFIFANNGYLNHGGAITWTQAVKTPGLFS